MKRFGQRSGAVVKFFIMLFSALSMSLLMADTINEKTIIFSAPKKEIGTLAKGVQVQVIKRGKDWSHIKYQSDDVTLHGYVETRVLIADDDKKQEKDVGDGKSVRGVITSPSFRNTRKPAKYLKGYVEYKLSVGYKLETKLKRTHAPKLKVNILLEKADTSRMECAVPITDVWMKSMKFALTGGEVDIQKIKTLNIRNARVSIKKDDKLLAWRIELWHVIYSTKGWKHDQKTMLDCHSKITPSGKNRQMPKDWFERRRDLGYSSSATFPARF